MFLEFFRTKEKTITRDEKGIQPKETHDKIEEELCLENDIEILTETIKQMEKELKQLGTLENNRKRRLVNNITAPLMIAITILAVRLLLFVMGMDDVATSVESTIISKFSDALTLYVVTPIAVLFYGVNFITTNNNIKHSRSEIILCQEELEMLRVKLNQKKTELENIRSNKKATEVVDEQVQKIDIDSYRNKLQKELDFLESLVYYRKRYYKLYQEGTLESKLQEEGIAPEDIELAKRILARTLEK